MLDRMKIRLRYMPGSHKLCRGLPAVARPISKVYRAIDRRQYGSPLSKLSGCAQAQACLEHTAYIVLSAMRRAMTHAVRSVGSIR